MEQWPCRGTRQPTEDSQAADVWTSWLWVTEGEDRQRRMTGRGGDSASRHPSGTASSKMRENQNVRRCCNLVRIRSIMIIVRAGLNRVEEVTSYRERFVGLAIHADRRKGRHAGSHYQ